MSKPLDIKSLAKGIKEGKDAATVVGKKSDIESIIDQMNTKDEYDTEGCVYIDRELHRVLQQLKLVSGLSISTLTSHLIEMFINAHKTEIKELFDNQHNKYL